MPPKKKHPGNKNSKGRPVTTNVAAMTHEEELAYKNRMHKISSKR